MKTNKIYIANLGAIKFKDYVEPGENMAYFYDSKKCVLVKEAKYKKGYIDLESRKNYKVGPTNERIGEEFLVPGTFKGFNSVTGNTKKHLSRTNVLKLYKGVKGR